MTWMIDNSDGAATKPIWEYRDGMEFLTVLDGQSLNMVLIQGDADPTKTWIGPYGAWIHEFKAPNGFFTTVFCDKWNEACPCCYENAIFEKNNPNFKNTGGRRPYGITKKAFIQVYVPEYKKVLWFLAGKQIQEGMDFIIKQQAQNFQNKIMITRTGIKLRTNYRVDISNFELTQEDIEIIKNNTHALNEVESIVRLSHNEFLQKSGINPIKYFERRLSENHGIDISQWGAVPNSSNYTEYKRGDLEQNTIPDSPTSVQNNLFDDKKDIPKLSDELHDSLNVVCTEGVYKDQHLYEILRSTGKTYVQYLLRSDNSTDNEKKACQLILDNWDLVNEFLQSGAF